jgi:hypothetical protein
VRQGNSAFRESWIELAPRLEAVQLLELGCPVEFKFISLLTNLRALFVVYAPPVDCLLQLRKLEFRHFKWTPPVDLQQLPRAHALRWLASSGGMLRSLSLGEGHCGFEDAAWNLLLRPPRSDFGMSDAPSSSVILSL